MKHLIKLFRNYREQRLRERCVRYAAMSKNPNASYTSLVKYYYECIKGTISWAIEPESKK